jgi:hypothetical protein
MQSQADRRSPFFRLQLLAGGREWWELCKKEKNRGSGQSRRELEEHRQFPMWFSLGTGMDTYLVAIIALFLFNKGILYCISDLAIIFYTNPDMHTRYYEVSFLLILW